MRYHNTKIKPAKVHQKGFTLIELMIVIAIIGILSAIAIPNFLSYRKKGMDQAAISSAKSFYKLAMADFTDTGSFNPYDAVTNPPPGFIADGNLNYTGSINFTAADVGAGTMTFQHTGSSTTYTLLGLDGSIS